MFSKSSTSLAVFVLKWDLIRPCIFVLRLLFTVFVYVLVSVHGVRSPADEEGVHDSFHQLIAEQIHNGGLGEAFELQQLQKELDEESRGTQRKQHNSIPSTTWPNSFNIECLFKTTAIPYFSQI